MDFKISTWKHLIGHNFNRVRDVAFSLQHMSVNMDVKHTSFLQVLYSYATQTTGLKFH